MKKLFFICGIAVSALAVSSSANVSRYQHFNYNALNDTVPKPMLDTAPNTWKDTMHNNMMKDTGMTNKRDSTKPAPPHH